MIIGTIALLSLLFGGGLGELFFIEKFEESINEIIVDKDRKKEILASLKISKASIAEYNETRVSKLKDFEKLNLSYSTDNKELAAFFGELQKNQVDFHNDIMDNRIEILSKITEEEWSLILIYSEKELDKRTEKEEEKIEKKGEAETPFSATKEAIVKIGLSEEKQLLISDALNNLIKSIQDLGTEITSIGVKNNAILTRKNATKEELTAMFSEMRRLRKICFTEITHFHVLVKEQSSESEFTTVMKAFNKELTITDK